MRGAHHPKSTLTRILSLMSCPCCASQEEHGERAPAASSPLSSSYQHSMRNLVRAAKRAREAESQNLRSSVGSSVGSSMFGMSAGNTPQLGAPVFEDRSGNGRERHVPKAARSAHHSDESEELDGAALGLVLPLGILAAARGAPQVTPFELERDPPHPGACMFDVDSDGESAPAADILRRSETID